MSKLTKLLTTVAAAATLTAMAAPASADVFIGLQNAGANGGALTTVTSGAVGAVYFAAYGNYELNLLTGVDALDPVLLDTTASVHNLTGTAGQFDLYFTLTNITGPIPDFFWNSYTLNDLPSGYSLSVETLVDSSNGLYSGTQVFSHAFPSASVFGAVGGAGGGAGPYSVTQHYTVNAATGTTGDLLATGRTTGLVPEPATWGMMIMGFAAIGSAMRNRRRALVAA